MFLSPSDNSAAAVGISPLNGLMKQQVSWHEKCKIFCLLGVFRWDKFNGMYRFGESLLHCTYKLKSCPLWVYYINHVS